MNRILLTDDAMHYDKVVPKKIRKRGKTINESSEKPNKKKSKVLGSSGESIDEIINFYNQEKDAKLISEKKIKKKVIEKLSEKWQIFKENNKF